MKITRNDRQVLGTPVACEVHVDGWGDAFFTIRGWSNDMANLSTRYSRRVKYQVHRSRLYFTHRAYKCATRLDAEREGVADA